MQGTVSTDPRGVWEQALGEIQLQVRRADFQTLFVDADLVSYDGTTCVVGTRNPFALQWLSTKYRGPISRALASVLETPVEVEFIVQVSQPPPSPAAPLALEPPPAARPARRASRRPPEPVATGRSISPRLTFKGFVVAPSNRLAHAACIAAAEKPGEAHNPLFMYGGVGLGKTHLLHAIGHEALARDFNVVYVSSETFVHEFITSISRGRMEEFRARYRRTDVLLIDDVQFIAGKEQTQEEFFHTFNAVYEASGQIVLTSDRHPRAISTLTQRLQSRFSGGLIADIQEPDLETRIAILQAKLEQRNGKGAAVPPDVLVFIAERAHSNVRELEGALHRVLACAELWGTPVSLELAASALEPTLQAVAPASVDPSAIVKAVCQHAGLTRRELEGRNRDRRTVLARQIAVYLLRRHTDLSLSEIGVFFGGRDHSTVLHAYEKIAGPLATDERVRRLVASVRDELRLGR